MIPENITRSDVLKAIKEIDKNGIPDERQSVKWSVLYNNNLYPPKYLISLANCYANGTEWVPSEFSGGEESNEFLRGLGFEIVNTGTKEDQFPIDSHSWQVLSDTVSIKHMDKSSFLHHGTGIPIEVRKVFGINSLDVGDRKEATLIHNNVRYDVYFHMTETKRTRLYWRSDFSAVLAQTFPQWLDAFSNNRQLPDNPPLMQFTRNNAENNSFKVELISSGSDKAKKMQSTRLSVRPLKLYDDYSRKEVHSIFSPYTAFTPQAGTWGIQGIISIPERSKDFIFFVTFGQQQGTHVFDEGITQEGVLSWQSQPRQSLDDLQIKQLIEHDETRNSIYLFLRTHARVKYTFLGLLKYISHDQEREKPVYFQWQILDWNPPQEILERIGLILQHIPSDATEEILEVKNILIENPPPSSRARQGTGSAVFRARKIPDYADRDAKNREIGLAGEKLVIEYEKKSLIDAGRVDLAERVRHVSELEGDGAGYDIESYTPEGHVKYIEVKTTKGGASTAFYMSSNEVGFAHSRNDHYYLYRVYEYDNLRQTGKVYIETGNFSRVFELITTQYLVRHT